MMVPRIDSVAALYALQNSMMLTPCGPSAVPTGGAGVAAPAFKAILTSAATFFFLGGISLLDPCRDGQTDRCRRWAVVRLRLSESAGKSGRPVSRDPESPPGPLGAGCSR